jgi:hypothetical protein
MFHVIEDAAVITCSKGVFKQQKLYYRGDRLYAGNGSSFVMLMGSFGTSTPNVSWREIIGYTHDINNPKYVQNNRKAA